MKKEIFAVLLLVLMLAGSIMNVLYLDGFIDELIDHIDISRQYADRAEYEPAIEELKHAIDKWAEADGYTHVFIRHSEIGIASDAFYTYLSDLCGQDGGNAVGSYERLRHTLTGILTMEYVTMGSIF